ncbi:MAG: GH3 auxin-responsive promoter family protein [Flavobacteriales bacterium]|nr:GH3 auxin-responsive promoter family protein [Flavobacteriales bacterium]
MGLRSILSRPLAAIIDAQTRRWSTRPVETQQKVLRSILQAAKDTAFGRDHGFGTIRDHLDFAKQVPISEYEGLRPYMDRVVKGERNVLWPGLPLYFAKTSGTTSGVKYIPITRESIPNHINGAKNALLNYVHGTGNAAFLDGKLIFLSGSPELELKNGIRVGRLSGISNHFVPGYLRTNQMPSHATNCIDDWEIKLDTIVEETLPVRMTLISGIPSWVQMYFDRINARTGKPVKDVFPDFSLFVYGGVNYEPYRAKMEASMGRRVDSIELFPASEGFFAYQDRQGDPGMLLLLDAGIFYEFIPVEENFNEKPTRLTIGEVELGKNYALIVSSNAGLWGYSIGDTVQFVSKDPYRVIVSGRVAHYTSAFGEHVIAKEVEFALKKASDGLEVAVADFHVPPRVQPPEGGLPYHEWLISFSRRPDDLAAFAHRIDLAMQEQNIYYRDLITGRVLRPAVVIELEPDAFISYARSEGKLGGQFKLPRLANDRKVADSLVVFRQRSEQ